MTVAWLLTLQQRACCLVVEMIWHIPAAAVRKDRLLAEPEYFKVSHGSPHRLIELPDIRADSLGAVSFHVCRHNRIFSCVYVVRVQLSAADCNVAELRNMCVVESRMASRGCCC